LVALTSWNGVVLCIPPAACLQFGKQVNYLELVKGFIVPFELEACIGIPKRISTGISAIAASPIETLVQSTGHVSQSTTMAAFSSDDLVFSDP
jgi:hypothetical protein